MLAESRTQDADGFHVAAITTASNFVPGREVQCEAHSESISQARCGEDAYYTGVGDLYQIWLVRSAASHFRRSSGALRLQRRQHSAAGRFSSKDILLIRLLGVSESWRGNHSFDSSLAVLPTRVGPPAVPKVKTTTIAGAWVRVGGGLLPAFFRGGRSRGRVWLARRQLLRSDVRREILVKARRASKTVLATLRPAASTPGDTGATTATTATGRCLFHGFWGSVRVLFQSLPLRGLRPFTLGT